jgi:lathosterol oxidase
MLENIFLQLNSAEVFAISSGYFLVLYLLICVPVDAIRKKRLASHPELILQTAPLREGQIKQELINSFISIVIFGLVGVFNHLGIKNGFLHADFYPSIAQVTLEVIALFFWNDLHFYLVHRLLHVKTLFRLIHREHHLSQVITPYSSFSMHWMEAILLGSVMPLAMLFHTFGVWSLLSLPVMSLILNSLGHSNLVLAPFTRRHALHHQYVNGNYGFLLPWFDQLFNTGVRK